MGPLGARGITPFSALACKVVSKVPDMGLAFMAPLQGNRRLKDRACAGVATRGETIAAFAGAAALENRRKATFADRTASQAPQ